MPIYEYECDNCGIFEVYQSIKENPLNKCIFCENKVRRIISGGSIVICPKRDFVTEHITGEKIRIQSVNQERRLLRQYGLVRYDGNSKARNRISKRVGKEDFKTVNKGRFEKLKKSAYDSGLPEAIKALDYGGN